VSLSIGTQLKALTVIVSLFIGLSVYLWSALRLVSVLWRRAYLQEFLGEGNLRHPFAQGARPRSTSKALLFDKLDNAA